MWFELSDVVMLTGSRSGRDCFDRVVVADYHLDAAAGVAAVTCRRVAYRGRAPASGANAVPHDSGVGF